MDANVGDFVAITVRGEDLCPYRIARVVQVINENAWRKYLVAWLCRYHNVPRGELGAVPLGIPVHRLVFPTEVVDVVHAHVVMYDARVIS